MGLLRVIFELLVPPRHEFTPVPDDWPPEGSLHFIKCTAEAQKSVPHTHVEYEFFSNWGEDDRRIVKLSLEVMKQLCIAHWVLTEIRSGRESPKKKRLAPERFTVRYHRFLQNCNPSISTYFKSERDLLILKKGFDATAFFASKHLDTEDYCFFDFYVFPDAPAPSNAQAAAEAVDAAQYDLWFNLSEYGPCALYITLNPETVDAGSVQKVIEDICQKNNILFMNPPGFD